MAQGKPRWRRPVGLPPGGSADTMAWLLSERLFVVLRGKRVFVDKQPDPAGIPFQHVPYQGGAPAMNALLAIRNATAPPLKRWLRQQFCMCRLRPKESHMATNLALDNDLLERAFLLSGEATKKAAVTRALQEFIARREQKRVAELFGKLDWDPSFDYKSERSRES